MLIPSLCVLCGASDGVLTAQLCRDCLADLPVRPHGACQGCGVLLDGAAVCGRCFERLPAFDRCTAGCAYDYPVNQMIKKLKYQARLDLVRPLCQPLLERIEHECTVLPDCLIPVPLHRARRRSRGFNQAGEIARMLAQALSLPVHDRLVQRHRATAQQYDLPPEQRSKNVKNAFSIIRSTGYEMIAVVDDVLTSGATAHELARLLKRHGAGRVVVWCAAQATPAGK